jgi:hypothetical protein
MAGCQFPTVTLDRRPHRDAVLRLRDAYRRLARPPRLPGAPPRDVSGGRLDRGVSDETDRGLAYAGHTPGGE